MQLDVGLLETTPVPLSLYMQTESEALHKQTESEEEEVSDIFSPTKFSDRTILEIQATKV